MTFGIKMNYRVEVKNEDEAKFFQEFTLRQGTKWGNTRSSEMKHLDQTHFSIEDGFIWYHGQGSNCGFNDKSVSITEEVKVLKNNKLNQKLNKNIIHKNDKYILTKG